MKYLNPFLPKMTLLDAANLSIFNTIYQYEIRLLC